MALCIETIPELTLTQSDLRWVRTDLAAYQALYDSLFPRQEQRQ